MQKVRSGKCVKILARNLKGNKPLERPAYFEKNVIEIGLR
jgi:hypothetical protein